MLGMLSCVASTLVNATLELAVLPSCSPPSLPAAGEMNEVPVHPDVTQEAISLALRLLSVAFRSSWFFSLHVHTFGKKSRPQKRELWV